MAMRPGERKGIAYATTCHLLVHSLELAYGVVLISIAREIGVTLLALGILANVFGLAYGITALPIGILADRHSATRLLGLSSVGMGLAAVVISMAHGAIVLGVGLSLLGIALGVFHPVANSFVSRISSRVGLGFAYLGTGGSLGVAIGPIIVGIIASGLSWRIAYAVLAVPCVVLGLLFLRFPDNSRVSSDEAQGKPAAPFSSLRPFLGPLIVVIFLGVLNGLIFRGVVTFLPTHLSENVNLGGVGIDSVLLAGSFTTIALLFGVAGQFLGGYLCDRHTREWIVLLSTAMTIPALAAVWAEGGVLLLASAAFFAFFHFMTQPVFNALITDYTPVLWRGRMFGIYFFCSLAGGSFSATGLGYVAETRGIETVFFVCAIFAIFATVFAIPLIVWAKKRRAASTHPTGAS
ncbi:MAG: MFS transporter [Dehalococcoidia bacterium]|nr:MFS transporter [Dehalococcoidia bacterium]